MLFYYNCWLNLLLSSHLYAYYESHLLAQPFPIPQEEDVFLCLSQWDQSIVESLESHDFGVQRSRLNELAWDMMSVLLIHFFAV